MAFCTYVRYQQIPPVEIFTDRHFRSLWFQGGLHNAEEDVHATDADSKVSIQ